MTTRVRQSKPVPALPSGTDAETLFQTHGSWLLNSLRRRYGAELAEDLVQETYLRLLRQAQPLRVLHPKAFLLRVARNLFVTQYHQDLRRTQREAVSFGARAQVEAADQLELIALKEMVLSLPQPLRDVFVLSRFAGMSHEAIADRLGIRVKTVEGRMTKALIHCAAHLRRGS